MPSKTFHPTKEDEAHYWATNRNPRTDTGTPYAVTEDELSQLQHGPQKHDQSWHLAQRRPRTVSKATWHLEKALQRPLSKDQQAAAKRIKAAVDNPAWTVDVFAKAFNDLDLVLYDRRLKGRVQFKWCGSEKGLRKSMGRDMYHHVAAVTVPRQNTWSVAVEVTLNAFNIFMKPTRSPFPRGKGHAIWGTVLHEMIHAYLIIMTDAEDIDHDEEAEGFDGAHGRHFQRCLRAVNKRAKEYLGIEEHFAGQRPSQGVYDLGYGY